MEIFKVILSSRPLLWLALSLPGAWIITRYIADIVTYGEVIHFTGDLSVQVLIITLAAKPLRLALPKDAVAQWLMRRRRDFGLACFGYALLHVVVYLLRKQDWALIGAEAADWGMAVGWLAFLLFLPLAATSNDVSVRILRQAWGRLHRLVYPAAVLALAHWVLTAFDPRLAYLHAGVLAALEAARIALQARARLLHRNVAR